MKIAFIGNGAMTHALGVNWKTKHELFISGRSLEKSRQMAQKLGAQFGSIAQAIDFAEVIILAVPAEVAEQTMAEYAGEHGFAGKTIIDISNPVSTATFLSTRDDRSSVTEALARTYPNAAFGKAFNMAHTSVWENENKTYAGKPLSVLYSADEEAKPLVSQLIADTGSEPVYLGSNDHAYQLEAAAAIVIQFLFAGAPGDTVLNLMTQH